MTKTSPPPRSTSSSHGPTTAHTSQRTRPAPLAAYPPAQSTEKYGQLPQNSHDFLRNPRLRAWIGECSQKNEGLSSGTCELSRAWSWRVLSARCTGLCLAWYACKWQTRGSRLVRVQARALSQPQRAIFICLSTMHDDHEEVIMNNHPSPV